MRMVWPSGAARATESAPITPPPPGRFSITNGLPSRCSRRWPKSRAKNSVLPPGVNGTMKVTGCAG